MKISILGSKLQAACGLAIQAVPQGMTRPVLSSLLVEFRDGALRFLGTDLESVVRTEIRIDGAADAERILVPAARLHAILREAGPEEVVIETSGQVFGLRFGGSRFRIPASGASEFPVPPDEDGAPSVRLPAATLQEMFRKTLFAAARELSAYTLNGVFTRFRPDGKERRIEMVGTDGKKMARIHRPAEGDAAPMHGILPARLAQQMERALGASLDGGAVRFGVGDRHARLEVEGEDGLGVSVSGRLVDGKYPDYESVIPRESTRTITVERERFGEAVRRAALLADSYSRLVRLRLRDGVLSARGSSRDAGEGETDIPVEYHGDEYEVGFNADFLLDLIRVVEEASLTIHFGPRPGDFGRFEAGSDYVYVVAPIELSEEPAA